MQPLAFIQYPTRMVGYIVDQNSQVLHTALPLRAVIEDPGNLEIAPAVFVGMGLRRLWRYYGDGDTEGN
jgi:hydrogenase-4 membrane subunit HyfE